MKKASEDELPRTAAGPARYSCLGFVVLCSVSLCG